MKIINKIIAFFKKAFSDMKASAKEQNELNRIKFAAAKIEAKAHFEENRGKNTFKKAKENARKRRESALRFSDEKREARSALLAREKEEAYERIRKAEAKIESLEK